MQVKKIFSLGSVDTHGEVIRLQGVITCFIFTEVSKIAVKKLEI